MLEFRGAVINTMIQKVKRDGCGFRSKERFKATIYFHLGGLDLYPAGYPQMSITQTIQ